MKIIMLIRTSAFVLLLTLACCCTYAFDQQRAIYPSTKQVEKKKVSLKKLQKNKTKLKKLGAWVGVGIALVMVLLWLIKKYYFPKNEKENDPKEEPLDVAIIEQYTDFKMIDLRAITKIIENKTEGNFSEVIPINEAILAKEPLDNPHVYTEQVRDEKITQLLVHDSQNSIAYVKENKALFIVDIVEDEQGKSSGIKLIRKEEFPISAPKAVKLFSYENNELLFTDGTSILKLTREDNDFVISDIHDFALRNDQAVVSLVATDQYYYGVYCENVVDAEQSIFHHVFRIPKDSSSEEVITFDADNEGGFNANSGRYKYSVVPCAFHPDYFFTLEQFPHNSTARNRLTLKNIKGTYNQNLSCDEEGFEFCVFSPHGDMFITFDKREREYRKYEVRLSAAGIPEVECTEVNNEVDTANHYSDLPDWYSAYAISPDGTLLFVASFAYEANIEIRATKDLKELDTITLYDEKETNFRAVGLQTDPDGQYLFMLRLDVESEDNNVPKPILQAYEIKAMLEAKDEKDILPSSTYTLENQLNRFYDAMPDATEIMIPQHQKNFSVRCARGFLASLLVK